VGSKGTIITFTGLRPSSEMTKDPILLKDLIGAEKLKSVIDRRYPLEPSKKT